MCDSVSKPTWNIYESREILINVLCSVSGHFYVHLTINHNGWCHLFPSRSTIVSYLVRFSTDTILNTHHRALDKALLRVCVQPACHADRDKPLSVPMFILETEIASYWWQSCTAPVPSSHTGSYTQVHPHMVKSIATTFICLLFALE